MKLGLLSAILENNTYEEVIDLTAGLGYRAVELACWPAGTGTRRYAGTCHIDTENLTKEKAEELLDYAAAKDVEIMALGYYPNPLDPDEEAAGAAIAHIKSLIEASSLMGINRISTFIGKNRKITDEENFRKFALVWPEIIAYAQEREVYVGIENCPMYFTSDEWPGGLNLASSPAHWRKMFEIIPSPYFGLSYDPSHLHLQGMDYIKPLFDFKDRIFHIHLKDISVDRERLNEVGIFTYPLRFMDPRIPGRGGIDWNRFMEALRETGFDNCACIEIEDRDYEENYASVVRALRESIGHIASLDAMKKRV
jgi:sugar phosphate isomerase/epimerase